MPLNVNEENVKRARNKASKKHKDNKQKNLVATLVIEGNPLITAGMVIEVAGVEEVHSGKWYITKATHNFSRSGFLTTLELARNATNTAATNNGVSIAASGSNTQNANAKKNEQNPIPRYNANGKRI